MQRLIKAGIAYNIEDLSARRAHALVAMVDGQQRSERERYRKNESESPNNPQNRSKSIMQSGAGVMDD